MRKRQKGFTLIELMVVIGIIVMLATLMVVNYQGASKKARDSRRAADLEQLRSGLEIYYTENNGYPGDLNGSWAAKLSKAGPKSDAYDYLPSDSFTMNSNTYYRSYDLCTSSWEGSPIPAQNALPAYPDQYCVQNP